MNIYKRIRVLCLVLPLVLSACAGAETPEKPQAPGNIPPSLERTDYQTGDAAKALLADIHMEGPAGSECWVATYGEGSNQIWMAASGFATPEAAAASLTKMQTKLANGTDVYSKLEPKTLEYIDGFQMKDDKNRLVFVFNKGTLDRGGALDRPQSAERNHLGRVGSRSHELGRFGERKTLVPSSRDPNPVQAERLRGI